MRKINLLNECEVKLYKQFYSILMSGRRQIEQEAIRQRWRG
jgi:hypothetical protein